MSSNIKVTRICQFCGKEFTARTTVTRTCGDPCAKRLYKQRKREQKVQASEVETQAVRMQPVEDLKAKEYLSVDQAATLLGVSRRTLYRMLERNELPAGKAGRRTIIRRADLDLLFKFK